MPRGKCIFRSGNYLRTASVLACEEVSALADRLHDHELGIGGDALYTKIGGKLIKVLEIAPKWAFYSLELGGVAGTLEPLHLKVDSELQQLTLKVKEV